MPITSTQDRISEIYRKEVALSNLRAVVLILGGNTGVANMHLEASFKRTGSTYMMIKRSAKHLNH
ncbi:hypothetical protein [Polaromonas sp. CG9_12]|nr:hypothetical protein [Polaromonas sp. CG9_12]